MKAELINAWRAWPQAVVVKLYLELRLLKECQQRMAEPELVVGIRQPVRGKKSLFVEVIIGLFYALILCLCILAFPVSFSPYVSQQTKLIYSIVTLTLVLIHIVFLTINFMYICQHDDIFLVCGYEIHNGVLDLFLRQFCTTLIATIGLIAISVTNLVVIVNES